MGGATGIGIADWAAIYAAIVATGALFLEVRRWFEGGARLAIHVMPEGELVDGTGQAGDTYLIVNVSNRGDTPTTITHFGLNYYDSWWRRLIGRPDKQFIVKHWEHSGIAQALPTHIAPGQRWTGLAKHDESLKAMIESGKLWVAISATHQDSPTYSRIRKPHVPNKNAKPLA